MTFAGAVQQMAQALTRTLSVHLEGKLIQASEFPGVTYICLQVGDDFDHIDCHSHIEFIRGDHLLTPQYDDHLRLLQPETRQLIADVLDLERLALRLGGVDHDTR